MKTIEEIIQLVSDASSVSVAAMKGPSRVANVALARQIACYLCFYAYVDERRLGAKWRHLQELTISQALGRKSRAAYNARRTIQNRMDTEPKVRRTVDELKGQIQ